jgi:hypothetical protein
MLRKVLLSQEEDKDKSRLKPPAGDRGGDCAAASPCCGRAGPAGLPVPAASRSTSLFFFPCPIPSFSSR